MRVRELWRYPVKSMRGVPLERAEIRAGGIAGDRLVQAIALDGPRTGRVITARTHPGLLGLAGTLDGDGGPLIEGRPWNSPSARRAVRRALGTDAFRLVRYEGLGPQRFDVLPLTIVTDSALERFGHDRRRLRPNVVVEGVGEVDERFYAGRLLTIGSVRIEVVKPRTRCVMTTFDPDTLKQDRGVLRHIVEGLEGTIALDARALDDGEIRVGDPVELVPPEVAV